MKHPRLISLLFFAVVASLSAKQKTLELPSANTGTGSHDFYNLGATVGDDPAEYSIYVAASKKFNLDDVTATDGDGVTLRLGEKATNKVLFGSIQVVQILLAREQMEKAATSGLTLKLASKRGGMQFAVAAASFATMLKSADKADRARARVELVEWAKKIPATLTAAKGSAKIHGQAFLKTRGGDVRVGAGNSVRLTPDDEWSRRAMELIASGGDVSLLPDDVKSHLSKSFRTTDADSTGNFEFTDVAPGRYVLDTLITWEIPSRYGIMETTGGPVSKTISVQDGQTQRVMLTL